MMHSQKHFLEFDRRRLCRDVFLGLFCRGRGLLLLHVNGAGVGHFFYLCCAAGGAGYEVLFRLFLKVLETREPALETMFLLANEIVDHHMKPTGELSIRLPPALDKGTRCGHRSSAY